MNCVSTRRRANEARSAPRKATDRRSTVVSQLGYSCAATQIAAMLLRWYLVVIGLSTSACALASDSDFPKVAAPMAPPVEFRTWWEVVESCSGRTARFDNVRWFRADDLMIRGELALGAWFRTGNRIALLGSRSFPPAIVRHEMLHAILQDSDHPAEFFQSRCGDVVVCGRDCPNESVPDSVTAGSFDEMEVRLSVFPRVPSISRYAGQLSFVVTVTNNANRTVYLRQSGFGFDQCPVGVLLSVADDPSRSVLRCDYIGFGGLPRFYLPGESRSVVVDVNLQSLEAGGGPFVTAPVIAGAVLNDNVRRTVEVSIRP